MSAFALELRQERWLRRGKHVHTSNMSAVRTCLVTQSQCEWIRWREQLDWMHDPEGDTQFLRGTERHKSSPTRQEHSRGSWLVRKLLLICPSWQLITFSPKHAMCLFWGQARIKQTLWNIELSHSSPEISRRIISQGAHRDKWWPDSGRTGLGLSVWARSSHWLSTPSTSLFPLNLWRQQSHWCT